MNPVQTTENILLLLLLHLQYIIQKPQNNMQHTNSEEAIQKRPQSSYCIVKYVTLTQEKREKRTSDGFHISQMTKLPYMPDLTQLTNAIQSQ